MPEWTQELKDDVIGKYEAANPTPETSTEIVAKIADSLGEGFTVNGVRVILVKAGKYIKKGDSTSTTKTESKKSTRVNKAEAINELKELIQGAGLEVDDDIVGKLTGKAAVYFKNVIEKTIETEEEAI